MPPAVSVAILVLDMCGPDSSHVRMLSGDTEAEVCPARDPWEVCADYGL